MRIGRAFQAVQKQNQAVPAHPWALMQHYQDLIARRNLNKLAPATFAR
jgi:hypothetical protein